MVYDADNVARFEHPNSGRVVIDGETAADTIVETMVVADFYVPQSAILAGSGVDFRQANLALADQINQGQLPDVINADGESLQAWAARGLDDSPGRWQLTFHHHVDTGRYLLIDDAFHAAARHTPGGNRLWGTKGRSSLWSYLVTKYGEPPT